MTGFPFHDDTDNHITKLNRYAGAMEHLLQLIDLQRKEISSLDKIVKTGNGERPLTVRTATLESDIRSIKEKLEKLEKDLIELSKEDLDSIFEKLEQYKEQTYTKKDMDLIIEKIGNFRDHVYTKSDIDTYNKEKNFDKRLRDLEKKVLIGSGIILALAILFKILPVQEAITIISSIGVEEHSNK